MSRVKWGVGVAVLVAVGASLLVDATVISDTWKGMFYQPSAEVAEIEREIALTGAGRRVFAATRPAVEGAEGFNAKCGAHEEGISVLGCYTDGQIYIYRITDAQLEAVNKVTAAHELLHAVWARIGEGERAEVEGWLAEVREANAEWFAKELETYNAEDALEEVYTRAGTKLAGLPEGLERHYGRYFRERGKIVEMYREYEAPFEELRNEISSLYNKIEEVRLEIEAERAQYHGEVEALDTRVEQFNKCANTAGCFSAAEFSTQREKLVAEQAALEGWRGRLNAKIDENNARVDEFSKKQEKLGGLYASLDSNVRRVEDV